jgi:hypothetical protein
MNLHTLNFSYEGKLPPPTDFMKMFIVRAGYGPGTMIEEPLVWQIESAQTGLDIADSIAGEIDASGAYEGGHLVGCDVDVKQ